MSKHLPGRDSDHISSIGASGIDFSTDSLLRQQGPGPRTGSAIQWVGPGQSGMPVSALLRQLCASRESVIRANVQVRYHFYLVSKLTILIKQCIV
jgi:hypothetical protein